MFRPADEMLLPHPVGGCPRRRALPPFPPPRPGQQQRVAIARSLIYQPAILLADEPTGNLDRKTSEETIELLKLSNRRYDQTILLITHDEKTALQADRIITLEDGKILHDEVVS